MGFVSVVFNFVLLRYVEFVVEFILLSFAVLCKVLIFVCLFPCVLFYYICYVVSCLSLLSFAMFAECFVV